MAWIEAEHDSLSVSQQCQLLNLSRSSFYYRPVETDLYELELMRQIDRVYTDYPFYGRRRITWVLQNEGFQINPKRVGRLMNVMGIQAIYPRPKTSQANLQNKIYPYLLKGLEITRPDQVWATDITYIPMQQGFVYLAAILDWYSRYVVSWALSTSLEVLLCLEALNRALEINIPEYFNSDQGSQYTSQEHTALLLQNSILISMDGRGRYLDNIFVERLWRTVKYEEVYLKQYAFVSEARESIGAYLHFYNTKRPHQSLGYQTPETIYLQKGGQL